MKYWIFVFLCIVQYNLQGERIANYAVYAQDLGGYGQSYDIEESDLLEEIEQRAKKIHIDREEIVEMIKRPTVKVALGKVKEASSRKFDPRVKLREDIKLASGQVLYHAGTLVNPLDYMTFDLDLVFVDGDDNDQKKFAADYLLKKPRALILLVKGSMEDDGYLKKKYFDQNAIYVKRFGIKNVPSVVYQCDNEKELTIDEVLLQK